MVPEGWGLRRLSEVLERVATPVDVDPGTYYQETGIRSHGKGIFHKEPVLGKALGNRRVFSVQPDCLVVNIVFAWEQAVARITQAERRKIASHRFPMYRPKGGQADVDFLAALFRGPRGKYLLELASPGGAGRNKTLGQDAFGSITLSLPPGHDQRRIASVLSTWDRAIETIEKLIENTKAQKKALMQQLLTDRRRLPGFSQAWQTRRLGEVTRLLLSNVDKKSESGQISFRLCNYTDVYYNEYITDNLPFMRATVEAREIEKFRLLAGDVLITKDSETADDIAVPAFVSEDLTDVVCGYHLAILRPDPETIDGLFLSKLLSLSSLRRYFSSLANGATRFGLTSDAISGAMLRVPEVAEQRAIAGVLRVADRGLANLEAQREQLRIQKRALMQQILTGKRRVKVEEEAA